MSGLSKSLRDTWGALKHWPGGERWLDAAKVAAPSLAIIAGIGFLFDWVNWYPDHRWQEYVEAAVIGFFVVALPMELLFRGVLLSSLYQITPRWAAWISTLLFVLSFPVYGMLNRTKWNDVFQMPSFWFAMLIFGIILSHIRIRSRSLWPSVFVHGFAATIWMAFLGLGSY